MQRRIHIPNHLILPFGTAHKLDLEYIKLSSVAANGIYFTTDIPCVYIDRAKNKPLTLADWQVLNLTETQQQPNYDDSTGTLNFIQNLARACLPSPTKFEIAFLNHYFSYLREHIDDDNPWKLEEPRRLYNALLPIPEMQLYVEDPLDDDWSFEPTNNFRVHFGFWTGKRLVAVEIDGHEPEGYARDVRRDRMLRRANIDVIHILNTEIQRHGQKVIWRLMPHEILYNWQKISAPINLF